jgi:hypothetical protein
MQILNYYKAFLHHILVYSLSELGSLLSSFLCHTGKVGRGCRHKYILIPLALEAQGLGLRKLVLIGWSHGTGTSPLH